MIFGRSVSLHSIGICLCDDSGRKSSHGDFHPDRMPLTRFVARLEQSLLRAWFPDTLRWQSPMRCSEGNSAQRRDLQSAAVPNHAGLAQAVEPSGPLIRVCVWLLTRSWLGQLASLLTARIAARRRAKRVINPCQRPPVVVIGNLVVGGSGKTPLVIALAQALKQRGLSIAVLCSGYGGKREGLLRRDLLDDPSMAWNAGWSDEAILLAMASDCDVAVARDRRAALALCLQAGPDLVLSDDGLQHHRLERAMEVLLVDARGLGNRRCLPAGPLREPLRDRQSSDWLLQFTGPETEGRTEANHAAEFGLGQDPKALSASDDGGLQQLAKRRALVAEPLLTVLERAAWLAGEPSGIDLADFAKRLAGSRLLGVAGIAQAAALAASCAAQGLEIDWHFPGDHQAIDLAQLMHDSVAAIVMTAKDAVKYGIQPVPVYVLVKTVIAPESLCLELERIARGQPTA